MGEKLLNTKSLRLIAQGNTADIYLTGDNRIIKLFRKEMHPNAIRHEFTVSRIVKRVVKECPEAYQMVELYGRTGILYERIIGTDMLKLLLSSLWKFGRYTKQIAAYHHMIQKDIGPVLWSVKEKLRNDISVGEDLTREEKSIVLDYLDELPDGNVLCHFDFHPGNIIIRDGKPVIIDWMTACRGDRCADAARTVLLLSYAEVPNSTRFVRWIIRRGQKSICRGYRKEYMRLTGINWQDIERWILPVAAGRLMEWTPEGEKRALLELVRNKIADITGKI